jgi:hypothetical protein
MSAIKSLLEAPPSNPAPRPISNLFFSGDLLLHLHWWWVGAHEHVDLLLPAKSKSSFSGALTSSTSTSPEARSHLSLITRFRRFSVSGIWGQKMKREEEGDTK